MRLASLSVDHYTHQVGAYELLWKRMSSGYALGSGELVRGALGGRHLWGVLTNLRMVIVVLFLAVWLVATIGAAVLFGNFFGAGIGLVIGLAIMAFPFAAMAVRHRSVALGIYSVVSWILNTVGFFRGFFAPRHNPRAFIPSRVIQQGVTPTRNPAVAGRSSAAG